MQVTLSNWFRIIYPVDHTFFICHDKIIVGLLYSAQYYVRYMYKMTIFSIFHQIFCYILNNITKQCLPNTRYTVL
jgi:hypothetical protein